MVDNEAMKVRGNFSVDAAHAEKSDRRRLEEQRGIMKTWDGHGGTRSAGTYMYVLINHVINIQCERECQ